MLRRLSYVIQIIAVLFCYVVAYLLPSIGVVWLVNRLGSQCEDVRTIAYMALVKLGSRNALKLIEIAKAEHETINILEILGDIGELKIISELQEFTLLSDDGIANAARKSVEAIEVRFSDHSMNVE